MAVGGHYDNEGGRPDSGQRTAVGAAAASVFCLFLAALWGWRGYTSLAKAETKLSGSSQVTLTSAPSLAANSPLPGTQRAARLVPRVVGMSAEAAISELTAAGFSARTQLVASGKAAGQVLAESPAGGKTATLDTVITLTISSGTKDGQLSAVVKVTDDGVAIKADHSNLTVPGGSLVRVEFATSVRCHLAGGLVTTDTTLGDGEAVTLTTSSDLSEPKKMVCDNLDAIGGNMEAFFQRAAPSPPPDPTVTWSFDGVKLSVQPTELAVPPGSDLVVKFVVTDTCQLDAGTGDPPEIVEGDLSLAVGDQTTLRIPAGKSYQLVCSNSPRAQPFVVSAAPASTTTTGSPPTTTPAQSPRPPTTTTGPPRTTTPAQSPQRPTTTTGPPRTTTPAQSPQPPTTTTEPPPTTTPAQ
jgi:hypothetical protein